MVTVNIKGQPWKEEHRGRSPKHELACTVGEGAVARRMGETVWEGLWLLVSMREPPSFQAVSFRMSKQLFSRLPPPHTLSNMEQGSESGRGGQVRIYLLIQKEQIWYHLAQWLATNYVFSATEVLTAHLGTDPGVRKCTVICHEAEGPGLRYWVPSVCQALCDVLNRGHHLPWKYFLATK